MDKQEYFGILFRRDVIRYVILRKPCLSSEEVSERLQRRIDVESINRRLKKAVVPTIDKYLALRRIKDKRGGFLSVLPEWLNPALVDEIVKDFQRQINKECDFESLISSILAQIERLTWLQGVDDMAENLCVFLEESGRLSKDYAEIKAPAPEDYDLLKKYKAAKRITIKERILGNNDEDVAVFRGAMVAYARSACETAIHKYLAEVYACIAGSTEINGLIARFSKIVEEAKAELSAFRLPEHPDEWDAEYNSLVPVAFFERNIEEVDAAMAFHMVLLQAFARHEADLRRQSLISDNGELSIFVKGNILNDNTLSTLFQL